MIPKSGNRFSDKIMRQTIRRASMPIRIRKLIGTVVLLVLVSVWGLLAMASSPHTDTSTSRTTVPISLRMRMGIDALRIVWRMILSENRFPLFGIMRCYHLRWDVHDYMVRAVSCKQAFHARSAFRSGVSRARGAAVRSE